MKKIILNDENAVGVLWFIPDGEFTPGKPCKGTIKERYREGSVYEGQGEYDGENFYRQGHGVQEFSNSKMTGDDIGGPAYTKIRKFVGNYDRHLSSWMYGNGVFYLDDKDGNPLMFVKSFFEATSTVEDWHGDFDYDLLLKGYTPEMEGKLIPFRAKHEKWVERVKDVKSCDYLFMGDSWVENWTHAVNMGAGPEFDEEVNALNMDAVNVGIGGSKYSDWEDWVNDLVTDHNPKKVFINLGFNDLHHAQPVNEVYTHFKNVVEAIKKELPKTIIYIASTCQCPAFTSFCEKELALNALMKEYCEKAENMVYLPLNELFNVDGKMAPNMAEYCVEDMLHLNRKGYDIWGKTILKVMTEEK